MADDYASRPVNYVSWGDAVRFANWMHNGQPTGAQGANTTEDGSYHINGAMTKAALAAVTRKTGATWVIPSEDEWYKSAYHKKDGVTGNYWDYPTGSDTVPSNVYDAKWDPGNNANFDSNGYTIGEPYFRTPVGEFEHSDSAYGTFDQGGNVWEWTEQTISFDERGVRGGSYFASVTHLHAGARFSDDPSSGSFSIGFRLSKVPEPSALSLMLLGVQALLYRRRSRPIL